MTEISTTLEDGRVEHQIKVAGSIDASTLILLKAEPLGQVLQEDVYLIGDEETPTWRIRKEGERILFTQKTKDHGVTIRSKQLKERILESAEATRLLKERPTIASVFKVRSLYQIGGAVVAVDDVEHLGVFTELKADSEERLLASLKILGFSTNDIERRSYLELVLEEHRPAWLERILRFHRIAEEFIFGITSGVLTTIGVLIGVAAATGSRLSVVSAVTAVAVADSYSDAYSMYVAKKAERGATTQKAFRYAIGTFAGKFILPLTFVIPLLSFEDLRHGALVAIIWGMAIFTVVSAEQLIVKKESVWRGLVKNLATACAILILSFVVGVLIQTLFNA